MVSRGWHKVHPSSLYQELPHASGVGDVDQGLVPVYVNKGCKAVQPANEPGFNKLAELDHITDSPRSRSSTATSFSRPKTMLQLPA